MNQTSPPLPRRADRQRAISEVVMAEGAVRIEQLAERFGISLMTAHRDLDELETRGLLRKSRGVATALSSTLVESSDVYRRSQQAEAKTALANAAAAYIEPGQSIFLDDSTTVLQIVKLLPKRAPLTVITNSLAVMTEARNMRGVTLITLGGTYFNWCNAFMGSLTIDAISRLSVDLLLMSTAAITNDLCYFQTPETIETKRAMFAVSRQRILVTDRTKFEKRALHALCRLSDFDAVLVDEGLPAADLERATASGANIKQVVVPPTT